MADSYIIHLLIISRNVMPPQKRTQKDNNNLNSSPVCDLQPAIWKHKYCLGTLFSGENTHCSSNSPLAGIYIVGYWSAKTESKSFILWFKII